MNKTLRLATAELRPQVAAQKAWMVLIILFALITVTLSGFVKAGLNPLLDSLQYKSALNVIRVFNTPNSTQPLSAAGMASLKKIPGVTSVTPWETMTFEFEDSTQSFGKEYEFGLSGSPYIPQMLPKIVTGALPATGLGAHDLIVQSVNKTVDATLIGKIYALSYTERTGPNSGQNSKPVNFTVVATFDNSVIGMAGPSPVYMLPATLHDINIASGMLPEDNVFNEAYVAVASSDKVAAVQNAISSQGLGVDGAANQTISLSPLLSLLQQVSPVVLVMLCLGSLLLGSTMGTVWLLQRRRDIGLLFSLGWSKRSVLGVISLELGLIGLIGGIVGALSGTVIATVGTTVLAHLKIMDFDMTPWGLPTGEILLAAVVAPPVCTILGASISLLRVARIAPDSALRDL